MAYVRKRKTVVLDFEPGHQWEGLVVRTTKLTTGTLLEVTSLGGLFSDSGKKSKPKDMAQLGRLFEIFAGALLSWNLEEEDDDGKIRKVPATLEGIHSQDVDFTLELIGEWIGRITTPSEDLGKDSTSGGTSLERSLPMEPRSPSLAS